MMRVPVIPLPARRWECFLVVALLTNLVGDLAGYWVHRLMHAWTLIWPIHRLHHSDEYVNVTTANRIHWAERVFFNGVNALPAIILPVTPAIVFALQMFNTLRNYFIHVAAPIGLGRISRLVFVSPEFHRLHHSTKPQHFNGNYGVCWAFWDRLFGTFKDPADLGFLPTGAEIAHSPTSFLRALLIPADLWRQRPSKAAAAAQSD